MKTDQCEKPSLTNTTILQNDTIAKLTNTFPIEYTSIFSSAVGGYKNEKGTMTKHITLFPCYTTYSTARSYILPVNGYYHCKDHSCTCSTYYALRRRA